MHYTMTIAGHERNLPICPISDNLSIGAFIMFGDTELTEACANSLAQLAPEHDIMLTAESKGIPLICAMARQLGEKRYVLARKSVKLYMQDTISCPVESITTVGQQTLFINGDDIPLLKDKKVLIIDDVISTGKSLTALENLVSIAGGHVVGKMFVLAEGDASKRKDITFLEPLPLFLSDGKPLA